jgi:K+-transporting ATPase ATPase C chain
MRELRTAFLVLLALTGVTGVAYPLAVTGVAQLLFPEAAHGSLLRVDGRVVGSGLIGQPFDDPRYFWSRPSAAGRYPYDAGVSAGSNLGPTSDALRDAVRSRVEALRAADPGNAAPVPVDLVTASASGLDPHLSPAAARHQAARVARVRGIDPAGVEALIEAHIEGRFLGLLGEPRVNVLRLNLALDGHTAP